MSPQTLGEGTAPASRRLDAPILPSWDRMSPTLRLLCAFLACAALAACGGSGSSASSDHQQITNLFSGMFAAMARGDYPTVCGDVSHRQEAKIVTGARRAGLNVSSCADALTAALKKAGITRAQLAQMFGPGAAPRRLDSISSHGDRATVTFTQTTSGQRYIETDALVREGGHWKADQTVKRTPTG